MLINIKNTTIGVTVLFVFISIGFSQTLCENLKVLEPLINIRWVGDLKSLDGKALYKSYQEFNPIYCGQVIKYTSSVPEMKSYSEGYYFGDALEKKVSVFIVNNNSVVTRGFVSIDAKMITVKGEVYFRNDVLEFMNIYEIINGSEIIDRWFQKDS